MALYVLAGRHIGIAPLGRCVLRRCSSLAAPCRTADVNSGLGVQKTGEVTQAGKAIVRCGDHVTDRYNKLQAKRHLLSTYEERMVLPTHIWRRVSCEKSICTH